MVLVIAIGIVLVTPNNTQRTFFSLFSSRTAAPQTNLNDMEKYTKFNVFGDDGRNHVITEDKPMTTLEVLHKYRWALSVGGIE